MGAWLQRFEGDLSLTSKRVSCNAAWGYMMPQQQQQQQRDAMNVNQILAALSGARGPESWAQLAALTSVGSGSSVQLPPLGSNIMPHNPFGSDSAVSQALLQHYWSNYLQQQQQNLSRGGNGSGGLGPPEAILSLLQAQQQQQQLPEGLNFPAFQQGLATLLSSPQQTSAPATGTASQALEALPSAAAGTVSKRQTEQLVQAAEDAGEARDARSETSGSCSSPDSKLGGVDSKKSRKRFAFLPCL